MVYYLLKLIFIFQRIITNFEGAFSELYARVKTAMISPVLAMNSFLGVFLSQDLKK